MSAKRVDINVDIGEGFSEDRKLLNHATSATVCCGAHAGSWALTKETIRLVNSRGLRLGVHPGYPDVANVGRKSIQPGQEKSYLDSIFAQVRQFVAEARPAYLKPHGALYSDTSPILPPNWNVPLESGEDAEAVFLARFPGIQTLSMLIRVYKLPLLGMPGTAHEQVAKRAKQNFLSEGFADRRYGADGRLLPRSDPEAIIYDLKEIKDQVLHLAKTVYSICIHGDTEGCVEIAAHVSETLVRAGYRVGN